MPLTARALVRERGLAHTRSVTDGPKDATELKAALREAGLRATASRVAVLAALRQATRPLSHQDLAGELTGGWDRATLYRNLVDLSTAGLAQKVELGDRVWRFDADSGDNADGNSAHAHFVCTGCGGVECLPGLSLATPKSDLPRAVREKTAEVQIRGLCDDCDEEGTTSA